MGGATEFCRHPGDLEGCLASLIEAFQAGTLAEHCIMIGLRHKHPQCLQVLTLGLKGAGLGWKTHGAHSTTADEAIPAGQLPPPMAACQAAVHLAWQKDIEAAKNFFVEFYQDLVWWALRRYRLNEEEAEVVSQNVFLAMAIRMKNLKPFRGKLSAYIWAVIRSQMSELLKKKRMRERQGAELEAEGSPTDTTSPASGMVDIPIELAEWWEDLDLVLKNHPKGKFEHRMLLAQAFICTGEFDKRTPSEIILILWQKLAASDEETLAPVAREVAVRLALSPGTTITWIAGDMLREGSAQIWHLPVVLSQDAGMTTAQVLNLVRDPATQFVAHVDTRVHAMKHLLAEHIRRDLRNSGKE